MNQRYFALALLIATTSCAGTLPEYAPPAAANEATARRAEATYCADVARRDRDAGSTNRTVGAVVAGLGAAAIVGGGVTLITTADRDPHGNGAAIAGASLLVGGLIAGVAGAYVHGVGNGQVAQADDASRAAADLTAGRARDVRDCVAPSPEEVRKERERRSEPASAERVGRGPRAF